MQDGGERGAGVFHVCVDPAREKRLLANVAAREIKAAFDAEMGPRFEMLRENFAEERLLGEIFRADNDSVARMRAARQNDGAKNAGQAKTALKGRASGWRKISCRNHRAGRRRCSSKPIRKSAPNARRAGRDGAGQDQRVVHHGQSAKNIFPQASRAHRRCNRGDSDGEDGCDPHAGKNRGKGKRQLNLQQRSARARSSPCRAPPRAQRGIDSCNARGRIADDWRQQGIERERGHRQARGALAEPWNRKQESEQRQTRNRLGDICGAEDRLR